MIRSWQSVSKQVTVPMQGGKKTGTKADTKKINRNLDVPSSKKRAVLGYPDVVIRLTRKVKLVGRRVVTVAVSSS